MADAMSSTPPRIRARPRSGLPRWKEFVEFMPAAWFRRRYPFAFLEFLLEDHKILREALTRAWPRAIRWELAMNERIVEIPFVFRALDLPEGSRVLDIGSRWSALPLHLAAMGFRTVATDLAPFPIVGGGADFVCADVARPPFREGSFDAAVLVSTLEHVGVGFYGGKTDAAGDFALMRAVRDLIRPGGHLVLTVPFGRSGLGPFQRSYDGTRLRAVTDGWTWRESRFAVRRGPAWVGANETDAASAESASQTRAVAMLLLERR